MTKEEIEHLPTDIFSMLGLTGESGTTVSNLTLIPYELWDAFTEEQLAYIQFRGFQYLSFDILEFLEDKYKDSQNAYIITTKRTQTEIISAPIIYRIRHAIALKKRKLSALKKVGYYRDLLLSYNEEKNSSYIPIYFISTAYMLNEDEIKEWLNIDIIDRSLIDLNHIQSNILKKEISDHNYQEFITKEMFLRRLESICSQDITLSDIPDIRNKKEITTKYKMEYLDRYITQTITNIQSLSKNHIKIYKIKHFLYDYQDLIRLIAYI